MPNAKKQKRDLTRIRTTLPESDEYPGQLSLVEVVLNVAPRFCKNESLRLEHQNGHADTVPHFSSCVAKEQIGEKAVTMCAHCH